MRSRYEVTLNGEPMSEIDENLLILDVKYPDPGIDIATLQNGGKDGAQITRTYKEAARVTVAFELHIYGIADRQEACQKVIAWARAGGILEVNDRPDQRLRCVCESYPTVSSVRNWTDPLQVSFVAYPLPWWEATEEETLSLIGKNASGQLEIPGTGGDAAVSVSVTANGYVTTLQITAGNTTIKLNGLSLNNGQTLEIGYDNEQHIFIRNGSTSLLGYRTADSSDELRIPSGAKSTVGIVSNTNVRATFKSRGCWI